MVFLAFTGEQDWPLLIVAAEAGAIIEPVAMVTAANVSSTLRAIFSPTLNE